MVTRFTLRHPTSRRCPARLTLLCLVALCAALVRADPRPLEHTHLGAPMPSPSSHVVYHALAFGPAPDARMDIYAADPVGRSSPVILYLHRGDELAALAEPLTTGHGAVVASLVLHDDAHAAAAGRAAAALVWLAENIGDFGGDAGKLVIMGEGAEAILASLMAVDPRYLGDVGAGTDLLAGVVAVEGQAYLGDDAEGVDSAGGDDERASSVPLPAPKIASDRFIAPHLLLHATAAAAPDSRSEIQSNLMAAALRAAGVRADVAAVDRVDMPAALGVPDSPAYRALQRFLDRLEGEP